MTLQLSSTTPDQQDQVIPGAGRSQRGIDMGAFQMNYFWWTNAQKSLPDATSKPFLFAYLHHLQIHQRQAIGAIAMEVFSRFSGPSD